MEKNLPVTGKYSILLQLAFFLLFVYLTSFYNYLLFHVICEFFAMVIAASIFIIVWNSRQFIDKGYLMVLGIGYFFIGILQLLHNLSIEGVNIIASEGGNISAQLWLVGRALSVLTFLIVPFYIERIIKKPATLFLTYTLIALFLLAGIFYWRIFPIAFDPASGYTQLYLVIEVALISLFLISVFLLTLKRKGLNKRIWVLLIIALAMKMAREIFFYFHAATENNYNVAGHLLAIASNYLIYLGVVETSLKQPYYSMFRNLVRREDRLVQSEKQYRTLVESSPDPIIVHRKGSIVFANNRAAQLLGVPEKESLLGKKVLDYLMIDQEDLITEESAKNMPALKNRSIKEFSAISNDGREIIVEASGRSITYNGKTAVQVILRDITERKKESEARKRYKLLSNTSSDIMLFIRLKDGKIMEANRAAIMKYGYAESELLKLTIFDLRLTAEREMVIKQMGQAFNQGITFEAYHRDKAGNHFPVEVTSAGAVIYGEKVLMSIVRDISARKKLDEDITRKKAEFEAIFNSISDSVIYANTQRIIEMVNPATTKLFGYEANELIGKNTSFLYVDQEKYEQTGMAVYNQSTESTRFNQLEVTYKRKDGSVFSGETLAQKVIDNYGKVIGYLAIHRDITARKREETELKFRETTFRTLVENAPDGIIRFDKDLRYLYVNPVIERSYGMSKEHIIGKTDQELGTPPKYVSAIQRDCLKALETRQDLASELSLLTKEGRKFFEVRYIPELGQNKDADTVLAIFRDITDRKSSADQVKFQANALANVNDEVIAIDNHQRITYFNKAAEKSYALRAQEILGKKIDEAYSLEWMDKKDEKDAYLALSTIGYWRGENIHVKRNGVKAYVNKTVNILRDEGGSIIGSLAIMRDITEEKKIELELHEKQHLIERIMDTTPNLIYIYDLDQRQNVYMNKEIEKILGFSAEKFINMPREEFLSLLHPDDAKDYIQRRLANQNLDSQAIQELEYRIKANDGNYRILLCKETVFKQDNNGKILQILGAGQDITERKVSEETIRQSEEKFRSIFEQSPIGIAIYDHSGRLTGANKVFIEMAGFKDLAPLKGTSFFELLESGSKRKLKKGEAIMAEIKYDFSSAKMKNLFGVDRKGIRYFNVNITPLKSDQKNITGGYLIQARDITENKNFEIALRESESRHRAIFDNAAVGILLADLKGRPLEVNNTFEKMIGYDKRELMQMFIEDFTLPEDILLDLGMFEAMKAGERENYSLEKRYVRKDGHIIWVSLTVSLLTSSEGKPQYTLGVIADITERKQAIDRVIESKEKLANLMEGLPVGAMITSKEGKILEMNTTIWKLLKYKSQEEFLKAPLLDHFADPEERQKYLDLLEKQSHIKNFETKFRCGNGKLIWCSLDTVAKKTLGKQINHVHVLQNITERKNAVEEIKKAQQHYRAVVEDQTELICRIKPDGTLLFMNDAYARYYGKKKKDMVGEKYFDHVPEQDLRQELENLKKINISNPIVEIEHRAYDKDNNLRWQRWISRGMFNENDDLTEIQSVGRDITERKMAEEALRDSRHDLNRAQEVACIGSWRLDIMKNKLLWSDESHRIFGIPKGTPLAYETFLACVHPDDRKYVDERWQAALTGEPYDIEHRIIVNGEIKWVREKAEMEFDDKGSLKGGFGTTQDITALKKTEEKIVHLASFPEKNPNPIIELDFIGNITYINPALKKLFPDIFKTGTTHPFIRDWRSLVEKITQQEKNFLYDEVDIKNTTYHRAVYYSPDMNIIRFYNTDISERKRAEVALKSERDFIDATLNTVGNLVVVLDRKGRVVRFNKACENLTGYTRDLMLGKEIWDFLILPEEIKKEKEVFLKLTSGDFPQYFENYWRTKEGRKYLIAWSNTCLVDKNGKVEHVIGTGLDITERKKAEEDLKNYANKLEEMTHDLSKFELAVENASDSVIITDVNGRIIYVNNAVEASTGFSKKETIGNTPILWQKHLERSFHRNQLPMGLVWHNIKKEKEHFSGQVVNKRKSGEKYIVDLHVNPIFDEGRNVVFYVLIERDISKQKEIDKAKTEFVSLASHQLRTPLSSISLSSELLLRGIAGEIENEQKKYVAEIYQSSQRMTELIKALLNVSRIELGTFMINPEPFSAVDAVESILDELKYEMVQKKIRVKKAFEKDLPLADFDKNVFRMIIENLISNAIRYSPQEEEIEIELKRRGNKLLTKVRDNGCGIAEEEKSKIFKKLYRTENAKTMSSEGAGLGLYIVKSLAKKTGSKIWFTSEKGNGTIFYAELKCFDRTLELSREIVPGQTGKKSI